MSIESVMPSNHLILCRPLLLLPSIFPSIRVFSNESALCIRLPKYWSFSFNISPTMWKHFLLIFYLLLILPLYLFFSLITNSIDMSLSKLQEIVADREAWQAAIHGVAKRRTWLSDWTTNICKCSETFLGIAARDQRLARAPLISKYQFFLCRDV